MLQSEGIGMEVVEFQILDCAAVFIPDPEFSDFSFSDFEGG